MIWTVPNYARVIAGVFVFGATVLSIRQIRAHLEHSQQRAMRNYTVRILLMVPVYAIESWVALFLSSSDSLQEWAIVPKILRESFEAFVLFSFMQLTTTYLGGPVPLARSLEDSGEVTPHPWPLCCFAPWRGAAFVYKTLTGTLQYIPASVLVMCTSLVSAVAGVYDEGDFSADSPYLYCALLMNFSQMYALYCLVLFYIGTRAELAPIRPLPKFLCIKGVVFFTWWQGLLISIMEHNDLLIPSGEKMGQTVQNFVICVEMFFFAIAHGYAFPPTEFATHSHNPRSKAAELSTAWDEQWDDRSSSRSSHFEGAEEARSERPGGMRGMLPDFHLSEFAEGINLFDILDMRREVMRLGKGGRQRKGSAGGGARSAVYSHALVATGGGSGSSDLAML